MGHGFDPMWAIDGAVALGLLGIYAYFVAHPEPRDLPFGGTLSIWLAWPFVSAYWIYACLYFSVSVFGRVPGWAEFLPGGFAHP